MCCCHLDAAGSGTTEVTDPWASTLSFYMPFEKELELPELKWRRPSWLSAPHLPRWHRSTLHEVLYITLGMATPQTPSEPRLVGTVLASGKGMALLRQWPCTQGRSHRECFPQAPVSLLLLLPLPAECPQSGRILPFLQGCESCWDEGSCLSSPAARSCLARAELCSRCCRHYFHVCGPYCTGGEEHGQRSSPSPGSLLLKLS